MQELKINAGWQRRNAMRTGGGKGEPKPVQIKLEVTGALLQLQQVYGHAMSGMNGFDCDGISSEPPQNEPPPHQCDASDIEEEKLLNDLFNQIESPNTEVLPIVGFADETTSHDDIGTPTQLELPHAERPIEREQFFLTRTQQHRSYKPKNNKNDLGVGELRRQFIIDEREHYLVEHEMRIKQRKELHEAKLLEISGRCREREEIFKKQSRFGEIAIAAMENETQKSNRPELVSIVKKKVDDNYNEL